MAPGVPSEMERLMEHPTLNPAAPHYLPGFITAPGQTDTLMVAMLVLMIVIVVGAGVFYLKLHALPEHMAHRTNKVQLQFVAMLALLALFTHNGTFWVAALLLAMIDLPDFATPINSIALSLERVSGRDREGAAGARWDDLLSNDPPRTPPDDDPQPPAAGTGATDTGAGTTAGTGA